MEKIPRERMFVVLILTFFSILFWSFFEQAGSSLNNFTDRNVDRVIEADHVTQSDVESTIRFRIPPDSSDAELMELPLLSQEQLGHANPNEAFKDQIEVAVRQEEKRKNKLSAEQVDRLVDNLRNQELFTITALTYLRALAGTDEATHDQKTVEWTVVEANVGMAKGGSEIPASVYQAANPIFILLFGLVLTALWTFMGARGIEPSTAFKFALGLLQLGLGFGALWYGAQNSDERGMVAMGWLLIGYLLHTTGELCLSPVGLSMVTKLSPARLVSTVMGVWFLATAFSQFLAAIIAQFTGISHGSEGDVTVIPAPTETVAIYGDVFGKIALAGIISASICFALTPLLSRWSHTDIVETVDESTLD